MLLYDYYSNFANLHIFKLIDVGDFGGKSIKYTFCILHWLMQML